MSEPLKAARADMEKGARIDPALVSSSEGRAIVQRSHSPLSQELIAHRRACAAHLQTAASYQEYERMCAKEVEALSQEAKDEIAKLYDVVAQRPHPHKGT